MSELKPGEIDCPVCLGKGVEHVCSWVCVEIKCSYCKGSGKVARPTPIPGDRERGYREGVEAAANWCKRQAESYEASRIDNESEVAFASRCKDARDVLEFAEKMIRQLATRPGVGDWVLVPREPTKEMCDGGLRAYGDRNWRMVDVYAAMLAAAPSASRDGEG